MKDDLMRMLTWTAQLLKAQTTAYEVLNQTQVALGHVKTELDKINPEKLDAEERELYDALMKAPWRQG